jgi:serine/threonine protein kinase
MVRRLGQGGMAEVFEAELMGAHGFVRRVAIKRILAQIANESGAAARFLEEARIASALHHAGIVAILDFGLMDDVPFQVLEFVDGLNADQLLERCAGRLPLDIALIIAADVAHALDHAHRARDSHGHALGIVHRDVKPSNVLVSWSGDIKLSDFGIAFAHGRAIQTETGVAPGTWSFMAPEQHARGAIDHRADLFALGCTLHALLTGRSPLHEIDVATRLGVGHPVPLSPELPADVAAIVARALSAAPGDRFASAAVMAGELGAALTRRLPHDPRTRLRDFLTALHRAAAPRPGLLDQLLAVEIVLASQGGDVRHFELRNTQAADPPANHNSPAANHAAPPALAPIRSRVQRITRIAALVLGLSAVAAAIAWQAQRPDPIIDGQTPAVSGDASASGSARAMVDAGSIALDAPTIDAVVAIPPVAAAATAPGTAAAAATASKPRRSSRDRRSPRATATGDSLPAPPAAPAPRSKGYLKVVARDRNDRRLINARVFVGGALLGYSPDPIETTVGWHRVRVVLDDDRTTVGDYSIEVTDNHRDRGHPATLLVP